VGKTTLTRQLCQAGGDLHGDHFITGLEQHAGRPFQQLFASAAPFSSDHYRYALANQVDYLLLRAEQELAIRKDAQDGVVDGGLEMDFFVFTRLFHQKGYLDNAAYQLCQRMYHLLRQLLPPPDLLIYLSAPLEVISGRFAQRGRPVEIATPADVEAMQNWLEDWLQGWTESPILVLDASVDDPDYARTSRALLAEIRARLKGE
jgi:deoxyadenosine/deoxycytidine kinase